MRISIILLALTANTRLGEADEQLTGGECKLTKRNVRELRLSINRKLDESDGQYYKNISVWSSDSLGVSADITLDAKHKTVECDGKTTTYISALIKELKYGSASEHSLWTNDQLLFHRKHGKNAVILDNGRTLQKLDVEERFNAVAFTSRPLRNNELFEVRLEKRTTKNNACLGIGVLSVPPEEVNIIPEMYQYSNVTWMYHNNAIYQQKKNILANYGRNINTLQVRERLGVMRRDDGELHFFVNGVDQGRAASNLPEKLYGIFELWQDAVKGTIVY